MKLIILMTVIAAAMAAPNALPEAEPTADAQLYYGLYPGYARYGFAYPNYHYGVRYLGKRSADSEPEADANPEADPAYLYRYAPFGYVARGYYPYYGHVGYGTFHGK
eukprot:TCALIF_04242-PA protein Name:"Protein of unknown function" AED:0.06 eAED:0.06 QI:0/0.5/0.33/0.66/0.5/0.66/3/211/106